VNAGRDPAKHGCEIEEAPALLRRPLPSRPEGGGLKTFAPLPQIRTWRPHFAKLREIRDELSARHGVALPDFRWHVGRHERPVREGSTLVRIGTALFGRGTSVVSHKYLIKGDEGFPYLSPRRGVRWACNIVSDLPRLPPGSCRPRLRLRRTDGL
jgi:hypothetical protein